MKKNYFDPNFLTPEEEFSREDKNKAASRGMRGNLYEDFRSDAPDVCWETEQLAKSYGIYLEFNRAKTGSEKEWIYMVRISIPGGGPIDREQWRVLDELSEKYTAHEGTAPSLRITTRQNLQFHWVRKEHLIEIVRLLAERGLYSVNGCGDNVRNIMACPLSDYSDVFNGNKLARELANYFRISAAPFVQIFAVDPNAVREEGKSFNYGHALLNRKFKVAISAVIRDARSWALVPDNCVELLTNDMGVAPIVRKERLEGFQVYIGGGQGEKNGKPTMSAHALPFARVGEQDLLSVLDAIVAVHQEWGDRQNRHWARLKYVVKAMGIPWYRRQVEEFTGLRLEDPDPEHDFGNRFLHHGWLDHLSSGSTHFGAFIENGQITDESPNGRLKSMVGYVMEKYPINLRFTPNQDLIFSEIPLECREEFQADLREFGFGSRNGKSYSRLRLLSGACVGLDTCRMSYTESEKMEPVLIDELDRLGWGEMAESIGVTGCERQCFRPATKSIGLIGSGRNTYQLKLMGAESARFQGVPLISEDGERLYLRKIPREKVAAVIAELFRYYEAGRRDGEDLGAFHRRIGLERIISVLSENPVTSDLMKPEPLRTSMERKTDENTEIRAVTLA